MIKIRSGIHLDALALKECLERLIVEYDKVKANASDLQAPCVVSRVMKKELKEAKELVNGCDAWST